MALTEQQQRDLDQAVREWNGRLAVRAGYPAPRKRPALATKAGFPVVQPVGVVATPAQGGMFGATFQVNAGASIVFVSARIDVPFIVYQLSLNSNVGIAEDVSYKFLVAKDSDTSGGLNTSGIALDLALGGAGGAYAARSFPIDLFPNFHVRDVPAFVKFAVFNNIGAARIIHFLGALRTI